MATLALGGVLGVAQQILGPGRVLFEVLLAANIIEFILRFLLKMRRKRLKTASVITMVVKKTGAWIMIAMSFGVGLAMESIGGKLNVDLSIVYLLGWVVTSILLLEECGTILGDLKGFGVRIPKILTDILRVSEQALDDSTKELERKIDGRLVINTSDPYKDTWRFDFDGNIEDLPKKDIVSFKVIHEDKKPDSADSKPQ